MTWEEVTELAIQHNLSIKAIAELCDVHYQTVARWMRGNGHGQSETTNRRNLKLFTNAVGILISGGTIKQAHETAAPVTQTKVMPTMVSLNVARVNGLLKKHGFTWQNLAFLLGNENFTEANLTTDNTVSQGVVEKIADIFKVSASELCISEEKCKLDMYTKMDARLDELKAIATVFEAKIDSLNEKFLNLVKVITNMEDAVIETYKFMKESKGGINEKN